MKASVVAIYMNLGPYHVARLRALAGVLPEMHAIEVAGEQRLYPWRPSKNGLGFALTTLFAHQACETVSARAQCGAVKAVLSELNPGVVVVAGYREPCMRAAANWARKHGVPVVLLFVSTYQDQSRVWWKETLKGQVIRRYTAVAATGQRAEEYALQLGIGKERIVKMGNVVDNAYFAMRSEAIQRDETSHRERLKLPDRYFVTVSRLSPEKNLPVLLQAFLEYQRRGGLWNLVLVGSGPQERELHRMVSGQAKQGVHFVPWASYEELPHYYALASCFVLPSVSEPWGLVVNEAMACGLPVLVSRNCGCVSELCREGENGYSFDPESVEELAQLMLRISASDGQLDAFGKASRRSIAAFTPETWAEKLKQCVVSAMERSA